LLKKQFFNWLIRKVSMEGKKVGFTKKLRQNWNQLLYTSFLYTADLINHLVFTVKITGN